MNEKEFWFKLTKWDTKKPDFCKVIAKDEKEAIQQLSDTLWKYKNTPCNYFSTSSKYIRNINDIMNFEIVEFAEVQKHIDKINFAIKKQEENGRSL